MEEGVAATAAAVEPARIELAATAAMMIRLMRILNTFPLKSVLDRRVTWGTD